MSGAFKAILNMSHVRKVCNADDRVLDPQFKEAQYRIILCENSVWLLEKMRLLLLLKMQLPLLRLWNRHRIQAMNYS